MFSSKTGRFPTLPLLGPRGHEGVDDALLLASWEGVEATCALAVLLGIGGRALCVEVGRLKSPRLGRRTPEWQKLSAEAWLRVWRRSSPTRLACFTGRGAAIPSAG